MTVFENIISSIVFLGVFALHPSLNKGDGPLTVLQHYVYGNSLDISTNKTIDKDLIVVKWICKGPNEGYKNLVIFKEGKQVNEIPSEKGRQILIVYYNNKVIGELPQNKRNKNQAHQYRIEILSRDNALCFKGTIEGPEPYDGAFITMATL
jgi:hypothetical protein